MFTRRRQEAEAERQRKIEQRRQELAAEAEEIRASGYRPFGFERFGDAFVCERCGSVIVGRDVHDAWHDNNDLSKMHDAIHYG